MYKSSTHALTWCGSQVPQVSSIRNFPLGFKSAINAVLALIRWKSSIVSSILAKSPSNSWEKGRVTSGTITSVSFPRFRTIDLETLNLPETSRNEIFNKLNLRMFQANLPPLLLQWQVNAGLHLWSHLVTMTQLSLTDIPKRWSLGIPWARPKAFTTTMAFSKDFLVKISEGLKFLSSMAWAVQLLLRFALLLPLDRE